MIHYPTKWIKSGQKLKITRYILTILLGLGLTTYCTTSQVKNHEIARIKKQGTNYQLTLTGDRLYIAHDPISALRKETYKETYKLVIPRSTGEIKGSEIPTEEGYYKLAGLIKINNEKMTIDLYYDNTHDNIKKESNWNGDYTLIYDND